MAYVANTDVAAFLGLDTSDTTLMADVTAKITIAEALINDYCGCSFVYSATPSTKYFDGSGTDILNLSHALVAATVVATVDNLQVVGGTYTITDIAHQPANPKNGMYRFLQFKAQGAVFPKGIQNIAVTGTWGLNPYPDTLKLAVFLTVKNLYDTIARESGLTSEREFGRQVDYDITNQNAIPPLAKTILRQYINANKYLSVD